MAAKQSLKYGIAAAVIAIAIIAAAFTYNSSLGPNTSSTGLPQLSSSLSSASSSTNSPSTQSRQSTSSSAQQSSQFTSSPGVTSTQTSSAVQGGSGALNIYLTDAPPSKQTLRYLLVNVSSVELRYEGIIPTTTTATTSSTSTGSSTTSTSTTAATSTAQTTASKGTTSENAYIFNVPTNVGRNINLTSLHGQSLLLGALKVPAGNTTSIVLNITGAKAFYTDGSSEQLKVVADGKMMIPIHFGVQANGSTDLTIDITPNLIHISRGGVLTPVIHVTAVEKGQNTTMTHTADVDESQNTTSTTSTSTTTTSTK